MHRVKKPRAQRSAPQLHCIRKSYTVFARPYNVNLSFIVKLARDAELLYIFQWECDVVDFACILLTTKREAKADGQKLFK